MHCSDRCGQWLGAGTSKVADVEHLDRRASDKDDGREFRVNIWIGSGCGCDYAICKLRRELT